MTGILIRKGNLESNTHTGRMPCEGEMRDQSDASTSQGTPDISRKASEGRRETWNRFSVTASEGANPAQTSISDFWPPELGENKFLLF